MKKSNYSIRLGIFLFLFITLVTLTIILIRTYSAQTIQALQTILWWHIAVILFLVVLNWIFEVIKLQVLASLAHAKLRFKSAFYAMLSNLFFSAITPFQSGGAAALIYIMHKNGISAGKGTAISFLRLSLTLFALGLATPIIILFKPSLLAIKFLKGFLIYSILVSLFLLLLYIYLLIKPKFLKRISILIFTILKRIKILSQEKFKYWIKIISREIDAFNDINVNCWKHHKTKLFVSLFLTLLIIISQFLIAPLLLYFLFPKINMTIAHIIGFSIIIQIVINFIMYFVPTPGGSGFIELTFMGFFSDLIPNSILGIYTILWRFFSTIVSVIVGAYVTLEFIGIKEFKVLIPQKQVFEKNIKPHID